MAPEPCLAVPCPLCRAPAGEPCHEITRERAERRPHNRRRRAYRVIFGRWPGDETDEEIDADMAEMERCHSEGGGDDV